MIAAAHLQLIQLHGWFKKWLLFNGVHHLIDIFTHSYLNLIRTLLTYRAYSPV